MRGKSPGAASAARVDEQAIDRIFSRLDQCHRPGAAVGIAVDGHCVYRKGFGLASMELPQVLTPAIRMRIYSTTKHFTCLAYLLLCEDGLAGIDDQVGRHLPELSASTRGATMRQLMGNISGIRDAHDIHWQFSGTGAAVTTDELVSFYREIDGRNFEPGTRWSYCNGGFILLTVAIERITGRSLERVLRERIFEPVGMHDTQLRRFNTDFVAGSATMHTSTSSGAFERNYLGNACAGEGGIVSTTDDMMRWLAHMDRPVVGSVATWQAMQQPLQLENGCSTGYGLGLFAGRHRGWRTIHHAGGGLGANSQMLKVPDARLDVSVMVNRDDVSALQFVGEILDACLPELESAASPRRLPFASGLFRSAASGRVVQLFVRGEQQMASVDGVDLPLAAAADGSWCAVGLFDYLQIALRVAGDPSEPHSIRLSDFGNVDELTRLPAAPAEPESILGRYECVPAGVTVDIIERGVARYMRTAGRFGAAQFRLEPLAAGIWRAMPDGPVRWGGVLSFDQALRVFHFSNLRTRALRFERSD